MNQRHEHGQRGLALVSVLWGLTVLALIAAAFLDSARTGTRLAHNRVAQMAADAAAEGAVLRAGLALTDAGLNADGTVYAWRFAGTRVRLAAVAEAGKVDLNLAEPRLLARLFQALGVSAEDAATLAGRVADFRDPDSFVRVQGAEDPAYRTAGREYGAKDAPFRTVAELQQVLGMDTAMFDALAPHVTVHGRMRPDPAVAGPVVAGVLDGGRGGDTRQAEVRPAADLQRVRTGFGGRATGPGVYGIRAEARSQGVVYAREAVVRATARGSVAIMAWRQSDRRLLWPNGD